MFGTRDKCFLICPFCCSQDGEVVIFREIIQTSLTLQWRIHIRAPAARRPVVLRITVITYGRQNVGAPPIPGTKEGSLCPALMWFVHFRYVFAYVFTIVEIRTTSATSYVRVICFNYLALRLCDDVSQQRQIEII